MLFIWFFKNCELIRDSSLWRSNFIPLVHDSIIIIGSRSVTYIFGSRFACKRWVRVFYRNLNFSFLGQVFQYFCWVLKRVYWGSHHKWICKFIIGFNIIHSYDATTQIRSHGTVLSSYRFGFTVVITVFNSTNCGSVIYHNELI